MPEPIDESEDDVGAGAGFLHGFKVQLQVAGTSAALKLVAFLVQANLVNQSPDLGVADRQPRNAGTRDCILKRLQEAHEVPHSEYMVLHEATDVFEGSDRAKKRMATELSEERPHLGLKGR